MIKKKNIKKNQGNSYIMVVATLSFLAVLVAAILVAVALCYRLKVFDLNARDNFYYLEQAMDEIYAGVGADSMKHLNEAYDDTIEVIVYYDTASKSYVTMENEEANTILKKTFIKLVKDDVNYQNSTATYNHLLSFLSNPYSDTNEETKKGIQLSVGNVIRDNENDLVIQKVVLKREAKYSTINSRKNAGKKETFVQTLTTDLVISEPEFNVNFNTIGTDLSNLYQFAMISDLGVEISGATNKVNITGNIYAASDFYNKDYNTKEQTITKTDGSTEKRVNKLNSYSEDKLKSCNGVNLKSMYSGLYIDGSDVVIAADKLIVPGNIAAMNSSELNISGLNQSEISATQIWADNIVLSGYSLKSKTKDDEVQGSNVAMRASAYIADDLEINAAGSDFLLNGQYYGYNYASTDNRTYTEDSIKAAKNRTFVSAVPDTIKDGRDIEGQAHYNSSAIIVNGEDSNLNLEGVTAMYIAGQSYIELSKQTTKVSEVENTDGTKSNYTVKNKDNEDEAVSYYTYGYANTENVKDEDGNTVKDNYTISADKKTQTTIQDYRTGEAISIKSNQLAYIPNWMVKETDDEIYLALPSGLKNLALFKDVWKDLDHIPVIKTVISGKEYYFFDFENADKDENVMNEFIAAYSDLIKQTTKDENGNVISLGESYGLTDINDYDYFKIDSLKLQKDSSVKEENAINAYNIYSNSAISVKDGTTVTVKARSSNIKALTQAADNINAALREQQGVASDVTPTGAVTTSGTATNLASNITTKLQSQYKEMKFLLSNTSRDVEAVNEAHTIAENEMSPINHYFNYNLLTKADTIILKSGYGVWLSDKDVEIKADRFKDGEVKGIIICKGDVTFDEDVKSFEGLIVSGAKIFVNQTMNFTANEEIIKSVLRECDESQKYSGAENHGIVCQLFKQYKSLYKEETSGSEIDTESTKSISAIQFEDILGFENWKKNVD